jgi:hypothetical protein
MGDRCIWDCGVDGEKVRPRDIIIISEYHHQDMQRSLPIFLILVLTAVILVAGCTSSIGTTAAATTVTTIPPPRETGTPASIQTTATTDPVIIPAPAPVAVTTTAPVAMITSSSVANSANDPYQENLHITKNYLYYPISNCDMKMYFPDVANDPAYGLSVSPEKVIGISSDEMDKFLGGNTEIPENDYYNSTGDPQYNPENVKLNDRKVISHHVCMNQVVTPQWNFVEVAIHIIPRNARPTDYTIGTNILSYGEKIVAQITTNKTFTLDQPEDLTLYIPLKTNDMSRFTGASLVYRKNS